MGLKTFPAKWIVGLTTVYLIFTNGQCAEITHAITDVAVTEDERAIFICTVKLDESEKHLSLAWEKDSIFIALENEVFHEKKRYSVNITIEKDALYEYKTSILKIRRAKPTDSGTLMCYLLSDDHLSVTTSAQIVVVESIPKPRCTKIPAEVIVGENVTISCTLKQLNYPIELRWWTRGLDDKELQSVQAEQKVVGKKTTLNHTFTVQSSDEQRTFKCKATHLGEKSDFLSCTSRVTKTLSSTLNVIIQQQNPLTPGEVVCFECQVKENLTDEDVEYRWSSLLVNPLPQFHDNIQCFGNVSIDNAGEAVNCTALQGVRSSSASSHLQMTIESEGPLSTTIFSPTDVISKHIFGTGSALLYIVIVMALFILMVFLVTILLCHIKNKNRDKEDTWTKTDNCDETFERKNSGTNPDPVVSATDENASISNQHDYQHERLSVYDNVAVEVPTAQIAISTGPCKVRTLNFNLRASTSEPKDMVKHSVSFREVQRTDFENSRGINRGHTQKVKPKSAMKPLSKALSLDQRRLKSNLVEMRAFNESTRQSNNISEPFKETNVQRGNETIYLNVDHHLNSVDVNNGQHIHRPSTSIRLEATVKTKSATLSAPSAAKTLNIEGIQYADLDFKSCGDSITQQTTETTQYAEIRK